MIGLSGAHRTGKSTLAQAFAQAQGIPFVATSASEVFQRMGLDPKVDYPVTLRYAIQEMILAAFEAQYTAASKLSRMFIADRTPLDLASYMLADIQRATLHEQETQAEAVVDYVTRCMKAASQHFSMIVLVQPGIKPVEAEGKAPACPAYMEHLNLLMLGMMADARFIVPAYKMPRTTIDLDERLFALHESVKSVIEANAAAKPFRLFH